MIAVWLMVIVDAHLSTIVARKVYPRWMVEAMKNLLVVARSPVWPFRSLRNEASLHGEVLYLQFSVTGRIAAGLPA